MYKVSIDLLLDQGQDCDAGGQYFILDLDKHNSSSAPIASSSNTDKPISSCPENAEPITSCTRDVEPITSTRTGTLEPVACSSSSPHFHIAGVAPSCSHERVIASSSTDHSNQSNSKFCFTESNKGGSILHKDGHRYRISKINKNLTSLWICTTKTCKASVTLNILKDGVIRETSHTCLPDYKGEHVAKALSECRKRVRTCMKPIPTVYEETMSHLKSQDFADEIPILKNIKSSLYRCRNKFLDVEKTSFKTLSEVKISETFGKDFLMFDDGTDEKILCFISQKCKSVFPNLSHVFLDGTFKVVPKPFYQIYTIHGDLGNGTVVPLLYALLPNKTQETYKRLFNLIKEKNPDFRPTNFKIDFEKAAINAINEIFPEAVVNGCFFHYSQAIWKKGKKLGFTETEGGKKFIGLCAAMAYLPHDHIPEAWLYLLHNVPNGAAATAFTDYMSNQWIKNSNLFTCHGDVYRTTNHVEGWHNRLNRRITKNPSLYHIIDVLKGEAIESDFKIDQLNNHVHENVPKKRRKTDNKDLVITKIIDDFLGKKIEIGICLQRLANVKIICKKK
ncbi:uncharacterized protein LOC126381225 [Pectinophora gossypiella]|uniref:uncharacterized protein LOC126381225 n=1 Tax=Pectinophora gossypiella TaxID=13191 RepID=UPI00214EAC96|nr:uncharacterized protein LOC126381225 [Pectinophora gossypiella]